jgi:hypothetical protein
MMAQYFNGKKKNLRYGLLFAVSLICGHVLGFAGRTLLGFMIQVIERVGRRRNEWDRDPHLRVKGAQGEFRSLLFCQICGYLAGIMALLYYTDAPALCFTLRYCILPSDNLHFPLYTDFQARRRFRHVASALPLAEHYRSVFR